MRAGEAIAQWSTAQAATGAVVGVPINAVSTAAFVAGGGLVVGAAGDLMMHAASDDSVSPARTDHTGGGEKYEPTEGFRGSEFSKDEFIQFVNGHTGDAHPTMERPTLAEIDDALTKGRPERIEGQNAEIFRHGKVKVILNYDMPWKSTGYVVKGR